MPRVRRRLTLRRAMGYALAGLVAVNALALAVFTVPRTVEERNLEQRVERLRGALEEARARNQALKVRDEVAVRNASDVGRFYGTVVGTREQTLLPVLTEIEAAARELNISAGSQSYEATPLAGGPLVRFRIRMPVSGTYRQVIEFLDRIERSPLFLTIDELGLRERPQAGAGSADLSLMFSAYFHARQAPPSRKGGRRAG